MKGRLLVILGLSVMAAEGMVPSIADTLVIREWLLIGPFAVAPREGITGVVEEPADFRPFEGESLRSGLVQGGFAVCRRVRLDSAGWLNTDYSDVRWDSIQDYYGVTGLLATGFAYAEIEVPAACRALAITPKVGAFYLNGLGYPADIYGTGWLKIPVVLDSGKNRVLLVIQGYGDQRVKFRLEPVPAPALIERDFTVPDLVADQPLQSWLGVPVVNTLAERITGLEVNVQSLSGEEYGRARISEVTALGVRKVPVAVGLPALGYDSAGVRLLLRLTQQGQELCQETLRLKIRKPEQARRVTFISELDGSCQYYALLYPENYDPQREYALILSTHGAGVEAIDQANAYKPKDWAFVVAPTNRRPYGFNWQDWGRRDALEVLKLVLSRFPIDPDRVLLTGHSMGGHGAWHIATTVPDLFAAVAPEAGWPSVQLYVPWFTQRSINFAEPAMLAVRDQVLRADNPLPLLKNLANLPVFILHGGDDDNVPTLHGRSFAGWLEELGYRYRYKEVPGRRHWWEDEPGGISVLDDTSLMAFLKHQKRNPLPAHVRFLSPDLGVNNRCYWVTIDRVQVVGRDAEIEAQVSDTMVEVRTGNVAQFSLDLTDRRFFAVAAVIRIDGERLRSKVPLPGRLTFCRTGRGWTISQKPGGQRRRLSKTPVRYGPAKQVMMSPFLLVYGTQDSALSRYLGHMATQEAMRWWVNANGYAEVLPDTEVTPAMMHEYNLVLYGGEGCNTITRQIARQMPIRVVETQTGAPRQVQLGKTVLKGELAVILTYPNPLHPERLVLIRMGTDPASTRLAAFFGVAGPSSGVPDFMVFDKSVRRYGWAGVKAAGFFNPDWQFDPVSTCRQN